MKPTPRGPWATLWEPLLWRMEQTRIDGANTKHTQQGSRHQDQAGVPVKCCSLVSPLTLGWWQRTVGTLGPLTCLLLWLQGLCVTMHRGFGMWLLPGALFPGVRGRHVTTWPGSPAPAFSSRPCWQNLWGLALEQRPFGDGIWGRRLLRDSAP